jgi:integrase
MSARKRANGEGTIYRRKDGRWEAALYATTTAGTRKRVRIYGQTREAVRQKLIEQQAQESSDAPIPERSWLLETYLDYWLEELIRRMRRPKTYELYEMICRLYIKPGLGKRRLTQLSVALVQTFLDKRLAAGDSVREVQVMRTVLSSALTHAMRQELVMRNVAHLITLPTWQRKEVHAWSADEARCFLHATRGHRFYPAFLLLLVYGLRRGEVLGLRWSDIDYKSGVIRIRQQVQRIGHQLLIGPTKTASSRRDLPMIGIARAALIEHLDRQRIDMTQVTQDLDLVFAAPSGLPVDPSNFVRSFDSLCRQAGVRRIRVHDLRRTVASLLNKLGVPPRNAQLILGHSNLATTQEIYTDVDKESRADALNQMQALLTSDR